MTGGRKPITRPRSCGLFADGSATWPLSVASSSPRKATILLPPMDHPECVPRLLAWICYPAVDKHRQRERLSHNLVAWWWRNCAAMGVVPLSEVPRWVMAIPRDRNFSGVDALRPGLNRAFDCCWAWRLARNSKLGVMKRSVGLHEVFDARSLTPGKFRDRAWAPLRPLIHVAEHVTDHLSHQKWVWEVQRRADMSEARALLDLVSDASWVPGQLKAAETLRLGWNAQLGLEPANTYEVRLADNLQTLGGQGDFIVP